jgi:hypothetical protein
MNRTIRTILLTFTLLALTLAPALGAVAADVEPNGATAGGGNDPKAELVRGPAEGGLLTALTTLIVFLLLVAVLGKFAWGPISKGLQDREDKIRRDIEEAEAARARAEASLKEYQAQLATAEARVREMLAKANTDAEQIAASIPHAGSAGGAGDEGGRDARHRQRPPVRGAAGARGGGGAVDADRREDPPPQPQPRRPARPRRRQPRPGRDDPGVSMSCQLPVVSCQ